MHRYLFNIFFLISSLASLAMPFVVSAAGPIRSTSNIPDFQLQIPIDTRKGFTTQELKEGRAIGMYFGDIYRWVTGAVGILAMLVFAYAGLLWLTARGEDSQVKQAQKLLVDSIAGVTLVLGSYIILATINPNLVNMNAIKIREIKPIEFSYNGDGLTPFQGYVETIARKRGIPVNILNALLETYKNPDGTMRAPDGFEMYAALKLGITAPGVLNKNQATFATHAGSFVKELEKDPCPDGDAGKKCRELFATRKNDLVFAAFDQGKDANKESTKCPGKLVWECDSEDSKYTNTRTLVEKGTKALQEQNKELATGPDLSKFQSLQVSTTPVNYPDANPTYSKYGQTMNDVLAHLPKGVFPKIGQHKDVITIPHEAAHLINRHLIEEYFKKHGVAKQALYIGNGNALYLADMRGHGVNKVADLISDVPLSIQQKSDVFNAYYLGKKDPNQRVVSPDEGDVKGDDPRMPKNPPTAILDEFAAYTIGTKTERDIDRDKSDDKLHYSDTSRMPQFTAFSLALAVTLSEKDPDYINRREPAFEGTLKYLIENGMGAYNQSQGMQDALASNAPGANNAQEVLQALRTSPDAEKLRAWARKTYNTKDPGWTERYLGFK